MYESEKYQKSVSRGGVSVHGASQWRAGPAPVSDSQLPFPAGQGYHPTIHDQFQPVVLPFYHYLVVLMNLFCGLSSSKHKLYLVRVEDEIQNTKYLLIAQLKNESGRTERTKV